MANPKGNPQNLRPRPPWKPGESGNPSGRPKKRPISDSYAALAEQELPEELRVSLRLKKGATYRDAIALAQIRSAIKGRTEAAREIREAIEGKAAQRLELTGPEGGEQQPVVLNVHFVSPEQKEQPCSDPPENGPTTQTPDSGQDRS